ncbi:MAG: hypothetical protein EOP04_08010 [Proteobacteria bacterium]|nr:MAG: hypothetical protein EOP04_08010 [Pseudomonadota bacterium]
MKTKTIFVATQLLFATGAYAGGSSSGTPPAKNINYMPIDETTNPEWDLNQSPLNGQSSETIFNVPSRDLIRTAAGQTLIPLSPQSIRRLTMRSSTGIDSFIVTDLNERFRVRSINQKLIDSVKAAEVVEKPVRK